MGGVGPAAEDGSRLFCRASQGLTYVAIAFAQGAAGALRGSGDCVIGLAAGQHERRVCAAIAEQECIRCCVAAREGAVDRSISA